MNTAYLTELFQFKSQSMVNLDRSSYRFLFPLLDHPHVYFLTWSIRLEQLSYNKQ